MQVVPTEQELPGLKQDCPPFILIAGELPNDDDIFIVAKGERILNVSGGHLVPGDLVTSLRGHGEKFLMPYPRT